MPEPLTNEEARAAVDEWGKQILKEGRERQAIADARPTHQERLRQRGIHWPSTIMVVMLVVMAVWALSLDAKLKEKIDWLLGD